MAYAGTRERGRHLIQISQPTFHEAPMMGLTGSSVSFVVSGVSEEVLQRAAVDAANQVMGAWEEPELPSQDGLVPTGRGRELLGLIYRACKSADWPVFQLGTFEPEGDCDLNGRYHLPTRREPKLLPFRLFRFLAESMLDTKVDHGDRLEFTRQLRAWRSQFLRHSLSGLNQRQILLLLHQRGQQVTEVGGNIFQVGRGKAARFIRGSITGSCGVLLTSLQADKVATARLLRLHGLPTVEHRRVFNEEQALRAADELGYPVVIKPFNGTRGRDVVCDIRSPEELSTQLANLNTSLDSMLVERQVEGDAFRFLLVNQQFGYCSKKSHAFVTGDGERTIAALIKAYCDIGYIEGNKKKDAFGFDEFVKKNSTDELLKRDGLSFSDVLPQGQTLKITKIPSVLFGSVLEYLAQDSIPVKIWEQCLAIARLFKGEAIGIDGIGVFDEPEKFVFNEVNFGPELIQPRNFEIAVDLLGY